MKTTETVSRHFTARAAHRRWLAIDDSKEGPHFYVEKASRGLRRYAVVQVLIQPIPMFPEANHDA